MILESIHIDNHCFASGIMCFLDNNGEIDLTEMANIIDTLDCIEGVVAGVVRYDENGHPVDTPSALQRAEDLFLVNQQVPGNHQYQLVHTSGSRQEHRSGCPFLRGVPGRQ